VTVTEIHPGDGYEPGYDRQPPQDLLAEQCVLGGMLLSKDAIADVVEVLRGADFYKPAHQTVYDAVIDLYGRGEPADPVTVANTLLVSGELTRVGGAAYLHTLIASVPTAANAGFYAKIVRERAILRRLVEAGTRIVQMGYHADAEADDMVDRAQAEVYAVTERRTSEDYLQLGEILQGTLDEIEAIGSHGGAMVGVPTGFSDLDALTNGLHGGQMIVLAARPGAGKSTMALDICRSASIRHGVTSAVFSLEMSRNEITMRLLSAEARVALHKMRSGTLSDQDWNSLARTMTSVSEAPLFIDDSPNLSMMEIRAKCRRLKQRHELRLVVIDYLQLMTSGKKVESRQQEVSEFSRSLKLLAKELDVPVIAVSQLNRGPEQRTDKKPQLSDLRESGCLTSETRILRADTGAETTMGELFESGARDVPVWALDDSLRYVRRHLTHVFPTGHREVFRLKLASGKQVRATANHPFLTYGGWRPLGDLEVGACIAVPRHTCAPKQVTAWDDRLVTQMAEQVEVAALIPAGVFSLPKAPIALFVRQLWTINGSVALDEDGHSGCVSCVVRGRTVVDGVAVLLLRFGISCQIRPLGDRWVLAITGPDDQRRFLGEIGAGGEHAAAAAQLLEVVRRLTAPSDASAAPPAIWDDVRSVLVAPHSTQHRLVGVSAPPSRVVETDLSTVAQPLGRIAEILDSAELDIMATNDVLWDEVVSVEPDGVEEVFDATVLGSHNFIANGIAVHNSIEQDSDIVILLHREDMYEKESPRAGEADFIVAKHRNGPTATVTVAFQGHYSRFVDMAQM
jgi:replicative DNA helicase